MGGEKEMKKKIDQRILIHRYQNVLPALIWKRLNLLTQPFFLGCFPRVKHLSCEAEQARSGEHVGAVC